MPDVPDPEALPTCGPAGRGCWRQAGSPRSARARSTCATSTGPLVGRRRPEPSPRPRGLSGSGPTATLPDDPLLHVCIMTYASDMTLLDTVLLGHGLSWLDGAPPAPAWTTRCGSTGRSAPTSGCCTPRSRRRLRRAGAWPAGRYTRRGRARGLGGPGGADPVALQVSREAQERLNSSGQKNVAPYRGRIRLPTCPWVSCRTLRREVPDVTNFYSAALVEPNWASRLGASSPPSVGFQGRVCPLPGRPPSQRRAPALPRVRGKGAAMVPQAQNVAVTALDAQTNIHNYMTSIFTVGEAHRVHLGIEGRSKEPDRPRAPSRPRTRTPGPRP